ncbi:MAG: 50S ribosomal protein L29 [Candidatus Omnitrophica bacterium]|nr:50S ribosomal protein L29 [Candidatus Omnitrophota bacterium]
MKAAELRRLNRDELEEKLGTLKKELFKLRVVSQTSRVEKPSTFRHIRRDIARILTAIKEQEDDATKNKA